MKATLAVDGCGSIARNTLMAVSIAGMVAQDRKSQRKRALSSGKDRSNETIKALNFAVL